ncbi:protein kinase [Hamiltosporidium magnivora]|uniref:Protein kinase n=1 Tax=Hamiltosporidium magnivora TaxID=148818 RepID=A0A4Q9LBR6_9MICR|nr:protein kinase [Hamiltosporidium magnivora]
MKLKNYNLGPVLGKGASSVVYLGIRKSDNFHFAIKLIPKTNETTKIAKQEIFALSRLIHPNIISLISYEETPSHHVLVLEKCTSTLQSLIENYKLPENSIKKIIRAILLGINYLHSMNFINRDLKLSNVLIVNGEVKISDFGLSCSFNPTPNTFCGTPNYLSPEMADNKPYDYKTDMYSLGVIISRLAVDFKNNIYLNDLIERLLEADSKLRISSDEALRHKYFEEFYIFINLCINYRFIEDFCRETKFGSIIKQDNLFKIDDIEIICNKKEEINHQKNFSNDSGISNFLNKKFYGTFIKSKLMDFLTNNKKNLKSQKNILLYDFEHKIFLNGSEIESIFVLENRNLKKLNFLFSLLETMMKKTPLIVFQYHDYKFTYFMNRDWIYRKFENNFYKNNLKWEFICFKDSNLYINEIIYENFPDFIEDSILIDIFKLYKKCFELEKCIDIKKGIPVIIKDSENNNFSVRNNFDLKPSINKFSFLQNNFTERSTFNFLKEKTHYISEVGWCWYRNGEIFIFFNDGCRMEFYISSDKYKFGNCKYIKEYSLNSNISLEQINYLKKVNIFLENVHKFL